MHAAWLAAGAMAVAMACGVSIVEVRTACSLRAGFSAGVAATPAGRHHASTPLAIPPIAETEISVDDVEPNEASSHSWHVASHAIRAVARAGGAGISRRDADQSVLVANAADLSRLCRRLL